ncbi:ABC transporter ATP-binding protein [Oceanobacillus jeddahense]|uniref:ABC transporter ATP-binding protein n=1 Tax=Oceanobacillus jeddahense TaxID=1462527 RepID=A0ABY5JP27_9BACI|nr:ABC transporter ATP-binding protein [Oceanobacillus jeddahense]UUI01227.1 ABC transporter ATP-binding protein [Oceanobacillus jeddahense]
MQVNNETSILEIKNLNKKINGQTVIDHIHFSIEKGDIFGFLGPNGAGKTTTLRMITRLIFPNSGDILIDGHSIKTDSVLALSRVGSIIENPAFYLHLTAKQNLNLSAKLAAIKVPKARINEVLSIVDLKEAMNNKVKTFSLGMKQRLGIANALLCYPSLIILDEPTNGVDPMGLREMKILIKRLAEKEKITFLISSHMLREMEDLCHKAAFIQSGKIVEEGDISELLEVYQVTNLEDLFFACIKENLTS